MRKIIISKNEKNQRFDRFISKYLNKSGNGFIQKMIRKKNIELNDKKAKPDTIIKEGDVVKFYLAEGTIKKFREEKFFIKTSKDLNIIYEDDNLIVINKPLGLTIQPDHTNDISLLDMLLTYLNYEEEYSSKTFRPAFINRLDKNTSGIVIAAKNYSTIKILNKDLRNRNFTKIYIALTNGMINENIILEDYMTRNDRVSYVNKNKKGKKIITKLKPIKFNKNYSFIEIELITGRTHQIRTHLGSIDHPILGDSKYGDKSLEKNYYLHAYKLTINSISDKLEYLKGKTFTAEIPKDFEAKIEELIR